MIQADDDSASRSDGDDGDGDDDDEDEDESVENVDDSKKNRRGERIMLSLFWNKAAPLLLLVLLLFALLRVGVGVGVGGGGGDEVLCCCCCGNDIARPIHQKSACFGEPQESGKLHCEHYLTGEPRNKIDPPH